MSILAIIPARYNSSRLPGKPLSLIGNKPMIEWVYKRTKEHLDNVLVATDDQRIKKVVEAFGGKVTMTSTEHINGTSRCYEAYLQMQAQGHSYDTIVNIQADEPLLDRDHIHCLCEAIADSDAQIATIAQKTLLRPGLCEKDGVFVVFTKSHKALYFSRYPIPYIRQDKKTSPSVRQYIYKHIGLYAFKSKIFENLQTLQPSRLEISESLEQNRWLENELSIRVAITEKKSYSVDTIADLEYVREVVKS
jgi:3-deoxy-manno-octulosonate cytidylyltransferase (CMP-KDO synthetase)